VLVKTKEKKVLTPISAIFVVGETLHFLRLGHLSTGAWKETDCWRQRCFVRKFVFVRTDS
jgi:hypothetical protein